MAEEEAVHLANLVWNYWKSIGAKPKMTWVELKHVAEHFLKECKRRGIDPMAVDFQHEICEAGLSYKEHLKKVDEVLDMYAVKPPEAYEVALEEAEKALREAGKYVLEAKEYEELKRLADKAERLERRVETLEREAERERAARAEAERKLEEEKAKFKPLKIRFLRDLPPWYRKGAVIETVDIPWALELIDKGIAERVPVEVAIPTAPPAPKRLSDKEVEELRRLWEYEVRRVWGRCPREAALHFDVELLPVIREMPYERARETVIREAGVYAPPAPPEVVRPPPPEVKARPYPPEVLEAVPMPPKVEVPKAPLSPLKFPRRPAAEEIKVLWDAFDYRMRSMGLWPWDYREYFEKYIANAWFSKWEDVVKSFEMMIKDISEGKPPAVKPTPLPWKEPRDAVLHLLWLGKVRDMDELLMALSASGIYLDAETVKAIIREEMAKPPEEQDLWFKQTSKEYLEIFLKN